MRSAADRRLRPYVVLHHTGVAAPHLDFLFEMADESPLAAFRLPEWPLRGPRPVTKLTDHRRIYLTYQGPISNNRGQVARIAEGHVQVTGSAACWRLHHPDGRPFLLFEPCDDDPVSDKWRATPLDHPSPL